MPLPPGWSVVETDTTLDGSRGADGNGEGDGDGEGEQKEDYDQLEEEEPGLRNVSIMKISAILLSDILCPYQSLILSQPRKLGHHFSHSPQEGIYISSVTASTRYLGSTSLTACL